MIPSTPAFFDHIARNASPPSLSSLVMRLSTSLSDSPVDEPSVLMRVSIPPIVLVVSSLRVPTTSVVLIAASFTACPCAFFISLRSSDTTGDFAASSRIWSMMAFTPICVCA
ncbi:hypothetical protein Y887_18500 [Xanthomonas pisi DSM 18956]|nr:hypothetical protein Y887_18500 [Xanthomonas pisi DSM 18956]